MQVRISKTLQRPSPPCIKHLIQSPVFAGHDASRALGMTSTKAEDVRPDWHDLSEEQKGVLGDWVTFFSKRYNIVGKVEDATNL
jgi:membrane-associated progesterone receptor component